MSEGLGVRRLLVSGSTSWNDKRSVEDAITSYTSWATPNKVIVIHGGGGGADEIAGAFARAKGLGEETFFTDWYHHEGKANEIRNQAIIDSGIDMFLAFINDDDSGDIWDLINKAKIAGVTILVL